MLKQRVITAFVMLVVLLAVLFAPAAWVFPVFMALFVGAAGWEWARLSAIRGVGAWACGGMAALGCLLLLAAQVHLGADQMLAWLATGWSAIWLLYAGWLLHAGIPAWQRIPRFLRLGVGFITLWMAWIAIVRLHAQHGVGYLLSVMAMVWMADVAAYFAGRAFGRRKLAPQISPGKSWAGAVGGMMGVLLMVMVGAGLFPDAHTFYSATVQQAGWLALLLLAAVITAVSVMGDLVESLMKRSVGMKDSSQLLPGHGGILDRVDSLLPVLPLALAATLWMHAA